MTPLIIFKGKYVWDTWMADTSNLELSYAAIKRGWMDKEIFYNYMEKYLFQDSAKKGQQANRAN